MKKKYLSLLSAILSIAVAFTFILLALVLVVRAINAKEYIPAGDANLWIIRVLQRLKAAGFNIFFSIMGIVLASILAIYRFTLAYFYFKVSKSDGVVYKDRIGEIVFFSVLACFVIGVTAWLSFAVEGVLPTEIQPFTTVLFLAYILLCFLPISEIVIVYLAKVISLKPKQAVPTREGIMEELDELADKTAMQIAGKQEEKETVEQAPISIVQPVLQTAILPRERKVVSYVVPYWDREDDAVSEQIKRTACTKAGVRKKNRKPSYSNATLRINKPISHKKRLKIMSPSMVRLRYKKTCRFERFGDVKRK